MAEKKLKNIIEDIAKDCLNSALTLRFDICTCDICITDMLAFILSRVPAKYVTTEEGALHTIIQQTASENQVGIARAILQAIEIISKNPRHELKEDKNKTFKLLLDKIKGDRGLDFRHYHQDLLKRRVALRMRAKRINSYSEYLRELINNPQEYDTLFEVLCINVSEFFRDPEVWVRVKSLFQDIVRQKTRLSEKSIKIWSAGCANGEEPYTISIILKELLKSDILNFEIEILATDVDKKSLSLAEDGSYQKESLKNVSKEHLARYFESREGSHIIKDDVKSMVAFSYLDLTSQDLIKETDLVVCRNVFIYFDRSLQEQLLMKFYNSLKTGGFLVMGKAETLIQEAREIYEEVDFDARIFRKK
jgi:chemotaxis methyl-accepting protein methylase